MITRSTLRKLTTLAALCVACTVLAGNQDQVKQRAKNLRDNLQEDVPAQPVPPSSKSAAPTAPPAAPPLSPAQKSAGSIQAELTTIVTKPPPTAEQKQRLTQALTAAATAGGKPTEASVSGFSSDLADAIAGKDFAAANRARFAAELYSIFNCPTLTGEQLPNLLADTQSILQVAGVSRRDAADLTGQLKLIAAEIRKTAGH
jgi:hypothetical protein